MPTVSVSPFFPQTQLGPSRIIYTPVDDIERRLRLAQLRKLELEPEQERRLFLEEQRRFGITSAQAERRLAEEERRLAEEERYHGTEAGQVEETQRLARERLATETGQFTEAQKLARERLAQELTLGQQGHHAAVVDTLMKTLPYLGTTPENIGQIASQVLKESGYPQLADSFATFHEGELAKQVARASAAYQAASPRQRETLLKSPQYQGELSERIKASLPEDLRAGFKPPTTAGTTTDETIHGPVFGYPYGYKTSGPGRWVTALTASPTPPMGAPTPAPAVAARRNDLLWGLLSQPNPSLSPNPNNSVTSY